jgi:hypothetical protein
MDLRTVRRLTVAVLVAFACAFTAPLDADSVSKSTHRTESTKGKDSPSAKPRAHKEPKSKGSKNHATSKPKTNKGGTAAASTKAPRSDRCENCDRDEHGRILRSTAAKSAFMKSTGYQHGRHGCVVDHIVPLACGGQDVPSNMQWQTKEAAKAKDKIERGSCR